MNKTASKSLPRPGKKNTTQTTNKASKASSRKTSTDQVSDKRTQDSGKDMGESPEVVESSLTRRDSVIRRRDSMNAWLAAIESKVPDCEVMVDEKKTVTLDRGFARAKAYLEKELF